MRSSIAALAVLSFLLIGAPLGASDAKVAEPASAAPSPAPKGVFRGTRHAVKFDRSIPLRDMTPKPIPVIGQRGGSMVDPDGDGEFNPEFIDQPDGAAQT